MLGVSFGMAIVMGVWRLLMDMGFVPSLALKVMDEVTTVLLLDA